jgi:hypothetical protein
MSESREPTTNHTRAAHERAAGRERHTSREREPRARAAPHESRENHEPRAENEQHERTSESAKTAVLERFQNISFGAKPASSRAKTPVEKRISCFAIAYLSNLCFDVVTPTTRAAPTAREMRKENVRTTDSLHVCPNNAHTLQLADQRILRTV